MADKTIGGNEILESPGWGQERILPTPNLSKLSLMLLMSPIESKGVDEGRTFVLCEKFPKLCSFPPVRRSINGSEGARWA